MGTYRQTLSGGSHVQLATWDDMQPPVHGPDLQQRTWNPDASRTGLAFYDSTVHYMRNDWASAHMDVVPVSAGQHNLLLYRNRESDTWHTAEALDIDHERPWKQHLQDVGTVSMADAQQAYNDVSNLRALPGVINRARNSAERALAQGLDSDAWRNWSDQHFRYDPNEAHPAFDPQRDAARRTATTLNQPWTLDDGRSTLSFDTRVQGKWFEHQLSQHYAGSVEMVSDEDGSRRNVHLFQCPATRQLVTRDAFDIDHVRPFEDVARERIEQAGGSISKAEALNLYNDTSNLRLVSRSANCSHEWELDAQGEYRDREAPETDEDRAFIEHGPVTEEDQHALDDLRGMLDRNAHPPRTFGDDAPVHTPQVHYRLNDARNPDHALFGQARQQMGVLNGQHGWNLGEQQLDNASAALTVAAKQNHLPAIDSVLFQQPDKLFAVRGQGEAMQWAGVDARAAIDKPIAVSSREAREIAPTVQAPPIAQVQSMDVDVQPMQIGRHGH
ncbi:XVIPCD domain-containing protein [Lysobacter sp. Root690]|uniref:XVIPCD domain-containing protein n=1 Tax=Lysobacter sp. Root690 TaxID=1736588 RepID=UPI0006F6FC78|nr:XVIPCD domain-containing protein [Lysobacter sp. Root690]KRB04255.1 hypothetical protein ASD86_18180 [Lysobacter sp. Root690]